MGKLSDILAGANGSGDIQKLWNETEAAAEMDSLPPGTYQAKLTKGELIQSRTHNTPGYRMEFVVSEGEFTNRRIWLDAWLTPAALAQTKRDLRKLGVSELSQLERPLPAVFHCTVKVTRRQDDNGETFNRVRRFDVTGFEEHQKDAFAPTDEPDATGAELGDAAEPDAATTARAEQSEVNADTPF